MATFISKCINLQTQNTKIETGVNNTTIPSRLKGTISPGIQDALAASKVVMAGGYNTKVYWRIIHPEFIHYTNTAKTSPARDGLLDF